MRTRIAFMLVALASGPAALAQSYTFTPFFGYSINNAGAWSIVVDAGGNLYSAATNRHALIKIAPDGTAVSFVGALAQPGFVDGLGGTARFNLPSGVTLDSAGSLYVADTGNRAIRKITATGVVTTLNGSSAAFVRPLAVAIDRAGTVYVADMDGQVIRKITANGAVSTLAGGPGSTGFVDGEGAAARFFNPIGLAIDRAGNLFIADYSNKAVRKVTPDGIVSTLARGIFVMSITADRGGNVYVEEGNADYNEPVYIRRITQAGTLTTLARVPANGGLAFDQAGDLYAVVADDGTILRGRPDTNEVPALIIQPRSQTVAAGGRAILEVNATGAPMPNFQWMKDGAALTGATEAAYFIEGATARDAGTYTCAVANSAGRVTSAEARLTVTGDPADSTGPRLANLSLRTEVNARSPLVAHFLVGPGSGQTVLVRAVGPALAAFGVSGALAEPKLELYDGSGAKVAENDKGSQAAAAGAVGAFPLDPGGRDAALVATLRPGNYTAQISAGGGTGGAVLLELYETAAGGSRLANLTVLAPVAAESDGLISGFTVAPGAGTHPLLIRALGSVTLARFGIAQCLDDPVVELFSGGVKIAENDNWHTPVGRDAAEAWMLNAASGESGAFALSGVSRDAALLVDLPAGDYTLRVRGVNGGSGLSQVEIYDARFPSLNERPASTALLGMLSFTVSRQIVDGRFLYVPQLRLVEASGVDTATLDAMEFSLEGAGAGGRVPAAWLVRKQIPAGGVVDVFTNPTVYGDSEFDFDSQTFDADYVSVVITYHDSANRTGSVKGITKVKR